MRIRDTAITCKSYAYARLLTSARGRRLWTGFIKLKNSKERKKEN
jgi:hypothetical protein